MILLFSKTVLIPMVKIQNMLLPCGKIVYHSIADCHLAFVTSLFVHMSANAIDTISTQYYQQKQTKFVSMGLTCYEYILNHFG